jgi:hypothetical protein
MPEYSNHQKKIIERYYDQQDVIMLNKLGELVTELYLAETQRKKDQLWIVPARRGGSSRSGNLAGGAFLLKRRCGSLVYGCVRGLPDRFKSAGWAERE